MSKRERALLFDDIRSALAKIQRYIAGLTQESFLAEIGRARARVIRYWLEVIRT